MNTSEFRRYRLYAQLGAVLVFFAINLAELYPYYSLEESCVYAVHYTLLAVAVVYLHYIYLFPLYLEKRFAIYFPALFVLINFCLFIYYTIDFLLPYENNFEWGDWWGMLENLMVDYPLLILLIFATSMYYFAENWVKSQSQEQELRSEKLQAELNFLKSQINPHFLFNTLNNIYAYAQTGNPKTAPMLERLSSILRFMVYECSENRVSLSKELNAIEDLLEIHKMKNSEQRNISLKTEGVKSYHLVAPLILVNFVENACKHSDVIRNFEGWLKVELDVIEERAYSFKISNTFKEGKKVITPFGGLGLENIKKRLDLQYADRYDLKESVTGNIYTTELTIPLERKH